MIRTARIEDLPSLYGMAKRYVEESSFPITYDHVKAHNSLYKYIERANTGDWIFLVDEDEESGVLCGGIMGQVLDDFCEERFAYVVKMYVEKEFRGLGTSRDLVRAFEVEAKKANAKIIFSVANSGMGLKVETLFVRLFEKFGFKVSGRTLVKEI